MLIHVAAVHTYMYVSVLYKSDSVYAVHLKRVCVRVRLGAGGIILRRNLNLHHSL